jgi:hypothetical protein
MFAGVPSTTPSAVNDAVAASAARHTTSTPVISGSVAPDATDSTSPAVAGDGGGVVQKTSHHRSPDVDHEPQEPEHQPPVADADRPAAKDRRYFLRVPHVRGGIAAYRIGARPGRSHSTTWIWRARRLARLARRCPVRVGSGLLGWVRFVEVILARLRDFGGVGAGAAACRVGAALSPATREAAGLGWERRSGRAEQGAPGFGEDGGTVLGSDQAGVDEPAPGELVGEAEPVHG